MSEPPDKMKEKEAGHRQQLSLPVVLSAVATSDGGGNGEGGGDGNVELSVVTGDSNGNISGGSVDSSSVDGKGGGEKDKSENKSIGGSNNGTNMASAADTLRFALGCDVDLDGDEGSGGSRSSWIFGGADPRLVALFVVGFVAAVLHGLVFPALAYVFSNSFSDLSGASLGLGLGQVRELAFTFLIVGAYALCVATAQTWSFELIARDADRTYRLRWFRSLLRQDAAFFDAYGAGVANQVGSNAIKFRKGVGRKFGEGIQFLTTGVGGLVYALYSDWRVSLVVLAMAPIISLATYVLMSVNSRRTAAASAAYSQAGGIAHGAVSSIRTVLSLNAVDETAATYRAATADAFRASVRYILKQGLAAGTMLGSMLFLYAILTLYGTSLLYKEVASTGCDPSGAVPSNVNKCAASGAGVLGAMFGVAFAAQGVSQFGNFVEAFAAARVAAREALLAIRRQPGCPEQIIYHEDDDDSKSKKKNSGAVSESGSSSTLDNDVEKGSPPPLEQKKRVRAILPKFEIDSLSDTGVRPGSIRGEVSFRDVHFAYPSRPGDPVLSGLSLDVEAGTTVALVGPSGGGKSTVVSLLERFYDPKSGTVCVDGVNLKNMNLQHLRHSIGLVAQEPTLFATTIRGNIQYGNPNATQDQIEEAARLANAHDFIASFPDGYDTQVGNNQLSVGQKQRLAIARVLVADPKILLLDEATSALDSESELVVQDAIDRILEKKKITAIIVAHRLSTIRNADKIHVIIKGRVEEEGTHDQLMSRKSYYRRLVEKQEGVGDENRQDDSRASSRHGSELDLPSLSEKGANSVAAPHIEFKNVSFSYPSRPQKTIINNFNLVIEQGQTLALVGPSGEGKSTTVGLIERFYDPSEGQLLYLGNDVQSLNVSWYRSQLAFVGQEPVLFNMSIADNILYGAQGVSKEDIEKAARQANAHDFICGFPEGYDTVVGSGGSQLSGGQKQRVAIARALVRRPRVLIFDEATSALDNESESIVQEAVNELMKSNLTVIIIAHRLSTIRNAERIALIAKGKVAEYGCHEDLMKKPHGRYKRLVESSKRRSTVDSVGLRRSTFTIDQVDENGKEEQEVSEEEIDWDAEIKKEEDAAFSAKRARQMARPDLKYMLAGSIGTLVAGCVFPMWGLLFSETIRLLFQPVEVCPLPDGSIPGEYPSCADYWEGTASYMRMESFRVAGYWAILFVASVLGNLVTFWGFGTASERLNKRVRDSSFLALLRQEVGFFDRRSVGTLTSQLQDDAARIHAFSGEPVRSFIVAMSSIAVGLVLSLVFMWQFALVAIGCIPILGFATSIEMKRFSGADDSPSTAKGGGSGKNGSKSGHDESDENSSNNNASPGGIIVETLLNMRTVSALAMERRRYEDYEEALAGSDPNYRLDAFVSGLTSGIAMFIQQWVNALLFWFGGWLLVRFPDVYKFSDYLVAQFSILFGIVGLGSAFQDMSDRKEVEKSAGRIFYLLDRESQIDPLSPDGKKLD